MAIFSKRLRELRESKGLSQRELAEELQLSNSAIGMYESGKRKPGYEALEHISDFFNVDIDYLLGKTDVKSRIRFKDARNNGDTNFNVHQYLDLSDLDIFQLSFMVDLSELVKTLSKEQITNLTTIIEITFNTKLHR